MKTEENKTSSKNTKTQLLIARNEVKIEAWFQREMKYLFFLYNFLNLYKKNLIAKVLIVLWYELFHVSPRIPYTYEYKQWEPENYEIADRL